jgi:Nickel responsive protein SCO4226-like
MKRYIIERDIPGAGELGQQELAAIASTSNDVVESLGVPYRWITSYAAGDKIYCVHEADSEEAIREHARRGGFPADSVTVVTNEFGPHTAAERAQTH